LSRENVKLQPFFSQTCIVRPTDKLPCCLVLSKQIPSNLQGRKTNALEEEQKQNTLRKNYLRGCHTQKKVAAF